MINEVSLNNRFEVLVAECLKKKRSALDALQQVFENKNIYMIWNIAENISRNSNINPTQQKLPSLDYVQKFMTHEKVLKYIDSQFWDRLFKETNILSYTSSKIRSEWEDQIYECNVPEFNLDAVRPTIMSLVKDLPELFAQRLRDAHDMLSRSHKTNKAQRFGKRMIFQVAQPNNWGSYTMLDWYTGAINDIRSTINQLLGGDQYNHWHTREELSHLFSRGQFSEWIKVDDFMAIKIFMKGTCHLEVDPIICDQLNILLADNTIPDMSASWYRKEKKESKKQFHNLVNIVIPHDLMQAIRANKPNNDPFWDYIEYGTYDAKPVLKYLDRVGLLPEYKSHQFYPTPQVIVDEMMQHVPETGSILEPSVGTGRLINSIERDRVTAYDIAELHCEILKAKGFKDVRNDDFLKHDESEKYDVILMNPPYSMGRALTHIDKARKCLNKGGLILAVVPTGKVRDDMEVIKEFKGVFDNTNIDTALVKIKE